MRGNFFSEAACPVAIAARRVQICGVGGYLSCCQEFAEPLLRGL